MGLAVINDLEQLRRLYALTGRPGDIVAVYHDVLNRTQDPMLRNRSNAIPTGSAAANRPPPTFVAQR
ncbi:hypothetical protein PQQ88_09970 [Paraburkholderia caledonica]|uniref:hypothetical protein n=1 Tax=Paraburkholderia caledonica TaxID=134536 RepID=UPI000D9021E7|nr:hypothetical protein [Paraburkholderia caledonica]